MRKYKFGYANINLTETDPLMLHHNTDANIILIPAKVPTIKPVPQNIAPRLAHMTQCVTTDIYSGSVYMVGYFPSS